MPFNGLYVYKFGATPQESHFGEMGNVEIVTKTFPLGDIK